MDRRRFGIWLALAGASLPLAGLAAAPGAKATHDWPNWRGPHFDGSSDETGLPVKFSETEGIRWSTELPGPSAATPIVFGDRVYVSAADLKAQKLLALCVDRKSGKVLWQQAAGSGYRPNGLGTPVQLDEKSYYSSPSPVADAKRVIYFYGNGDLVAFTPEGNRLWARNIQQDYGDFCFGWTFSSSPQLYDGKLYFQVLQRDHPVSGRGKEGSPSFLLCLDPATGKQLWRVERPCVAKMESREAFTTPIPHEHDGKKEILLAGGDTLSGHDAATGKELWRWGTWNQGHARGDYRLVPSPVAGGGVVLGCGPKREPVFAVHLNGTGDVSDSGLAWKSPDRGDVTTDVPTPLFYRGKFYVLSDVRKNISCVNPADGKILWTTPLTGPTMCWASPTAGDGKLYVMNLKADVMVLDAATGNILSTNPMASDESEIRSSVVPAYGNLFIRTNTRLFCVGAPEK